MPKNAELKVKSRIEARKLSSFSQYQYIIRQYLESETPRTIFDFQVKSLFSGAHISKLGALEEAQEERKKFIEGLKYHNLFIRSLVKNTIILNDMHKHQSTQPIPIETLACSVLFMEGNEEFEIEVTDVPAMERELRVCHTRMDYFEMLLHTQVRAAILKRKKALQAKIEFENLSRAQRELLRRYE